jgi:signal peptidase II
VDFLSFRFHHFEWPAFNVADAAICIGVGLYILDSFLRKEPVSDGDAPPSPAEKSAP